MREIAFAILLLSVSGACFAQCSGTSATHASLQWSEPVSIIAPDRNWVIEAHPILNADENRTPVTLRECRGSRAWPMFILERNAEIYWSPDSKHVLAIDEPVSGTRKLLLFSVASLTAGARGPPSDALDKVVSGDIAKRIRAGMHIQFYLPRFVSWKNNSLLLAIGGESYTANVGPLDVYCYGVQINTATSRVENVLPEGRLKAITAGGCQVSP